MIFNSVLQTPTAFLAHQLKMAALEEYIYIFKNRWMQKRHKKKSGKRYMWQVCFCFRTEQCSYTYLSHLSENYNRIRDEPKMCGGGCISVKLCQQYKLHHLLWDFFPFRLGRVLWQYMEYCWGGNHFNSLCSLLSTKCPWVNPGCSPN